MLNKRQEIFQTAIKGKLRVQDRASERMQDQIIEEIKELEGTKTEEALEIAEKEHDLWMYKKEKEEAKRLQGVRQLRKGEDMVWPGWGRGKKGGKWRVEVGARGGSGKCPKSLSCRMRWRDGEERCSMRARRLEVRKGK